MEGEAELSLGRNIAFALGAFALGSAAFAVFPVLDSPVFQTMLSTSILIVTAIVGLMLWEIGNRTGQPLPRLLALALPVLVILELIHTVAMPQPMAQYVIFGQLETRWRAATWSPTAYYLPLAILLIVTMQERIKRHGALFLFGLVVAAAAMLVAFEALPRYTDPIAIGITAPALILSPLLWAGAGYLCWQRRAQSEIMTMLVLMAVVMVIGNTVMLYSHSYDDAPAMIAHFAKFLGKLFFLTSLMEMSAIEMARRVRAEGALQNLNLQLEQRVRERTKQVEHSNDALKGEVMRRQQAERRLQIQFDRLSLIDRITRSVAARQDLPSIFQVVIRSLEDQMPVDFAMIGLYDMDDRVMTVTHLGVKSRPIAIAIAMGENTRVPVDESGLARSLKGELVYEPDISGVPLHFSSRLAGGGIRALVIAPLLSEAKIFGMLVIARRAPESFTSTDCEFVRQLCEHVSLAAHQAQLRETLQKAYDDLRQSRQTVMQQERLRALGQMASGIAHDINNAISPMALHTQSLLETGSNLSPRIRSYLELVHRVTDDVTATVARMREFYRERDPEMTLEPVDLNQLAHQVIDLTRARWGDMPQRAGVTIEMRTDLAVNLPNGKAIASEVREALTNLIFNAVDAMPKGGQLTVRTGMASPHGDVRRVKIEVIDTGVGMDDDTRRRCLEPFFTTKGERGTGLGLAMVYGAMQRLDGDLEIDSELGKGTTFRLIFPVCETLTIMAPVTVSPQSVPSLNILIIDDDPVILDSMRLVLELDGHTVTAANDGRAGVETFKAAHDAGENFSVVITDLGMPYMDGHEVARAIKMMSANTPVILLTGWGRRMSGSENDMPANVDRTLDKPPKLPELREALAGTLAMAGQ
jgi:signal transduction histidine kinase/ActR/RegA family two-component response regulator